MQSAVSIVVAAYNEGRRLGRSLGEIERTMLAWAASDWELIVVDDGSTDDTAGVLTEFSATTAAPLRLLTHSPNQGLIAAMRTGAEAASYPTVVFLDADLSYAASVVRALVSAKVRADAAVAVASPYLPGGRTANVPFDRLAASKAANWLLSLCAGGHVKTFTGMVRAYDTALARELLSGDPVGEFNTWALAKCIEQDRRIVEIPAELRWPERRNAGRSRLTLSQLVERTSLVIETARYLRAACGRSRTLRTGTLVLREGPAVPYSLQS